MISTIAEVPEQLDLHDIQGNLLKAYGRFAYPKARFICFEVLDGMGARRFVSELTPSITNTAPWRDCDSGKKIDPLPAVATNIAFTYSGLRELGVPQTALQSFPEEFAMGMRARRDLLGDDGPSSPTYWDAVWLKGEQVHGLLSLHGRDEVSLERRYQQIAALAKRCGNAVRVLTGHRGQHDASDLPYQTASALTEDDAVSPKEHFGYIDGISDPYFKGSLAHPSNLIGNGKLTGEKSPAAEDWQRWQRWQPLETGEFLLGYRDEAEARPHAPCPQLLSFNGTFMVLRKLHENVGSFDQYMEHIGREFPEGAEALAAKLAGRWRNGAPLSKFPTQLSADNIAAQWLSAKQAITQAKSSIERRAAKTKFAELQQRFTAFDFSDDAAGGRCPLGAHTRRANPRSGPNPLSDLPEAEPRSARHRILRRGLPYGDSSSARSDSGEHGIVFIGLCANLKRQFEYVQKQWLNGGDDLSLGDERDPLTGAHPAEGGSLTLQADPAERLPPFFCNKLPRLVTTRGGDYFFVPSLTALRLIGDGSLDAM